MSYHSVGELGNAEKEMNFFGKRTCVGCSLCESEYTYFRISIGFEVSSRLPWSI
jgi:hypothetical protein